MIPTATQGPLAVVSSLEHQKWISQWRRGDKDATERLFRYHHVAAYRLAYALIKHREDADDLVQDALTKALLRPELYDPTRGSLKTWINAIVVNRCRQHKRKESRRRTLFSLWGGRLSAAKEEVTPEKKSVKHQQALAVQEAVDTLSPLLKEAIVLRMWGDHTYLEIGAIVGCPARTAQSRVRLAMKALHGILATEHTNPRSNG